MFKLERIHLKESSHPGPSGGIWISSLDPRIYKNFQIPLNKSHSRNASLTKTLDHQPAKV